RHGDVFRPAGRDAVDRRRPPGRQALWRRPHLDCQRFLGSVRTSTMRNPHRFNPDSLWRTARGAVAAMALVGSVFGGALPTQAADGVTAAVPPTPGFTLPSPIWIPGALGGHLWSADA